MKCQRKAKVYILPVFDVNCKTSIIFLVFKLSCGQGTVSSAHKINFCNLIDNNIVFSQCIY